MQENQMEYNIITILSNAGAADYIPNFARHHISIETLIQMSDDDLVRVSHYIHFTKVIIELGLLIMPWVAFVQFGDSARSLLRADHDAQFEEMKLVSLHFHCCYLFVSAIIRCL